MGHNPVAVKKKFHPTPKSATRNSGNHWKWPVPKSNSDPLKAFDCIPNAIIVSCPKCSTCLREIGSVTEMFPIVPDDERVKLLLHDVAGFFE